MRRPSRLWLCAVALWSLVGCRCGPIVSPLNGGFRVDPQTADVDFGRIAEGDSKTLPVLLVAETRAGVTVAVTYTGPFTGDATVEVPGGGQVEVPITFRAGNGAATGVATFTVGETILTATLHGLGVRPLVCVPSRECVQSTYDLASHSCIETPSADDAPCEPGSQCLVQGRCRAGSCLGVARTCDDNNKCTSNACSMSVGCVHTPIQCPAPANPCRVATCDAVTGCGDAPAADGTVCGAISCEEANVCVSGVCQAIPTPEGFPCAPAIACLPEGQCRNKECVRPDAGVWVAEWSARIDGTIGSEDELVERDSLLFFTACGVSAARVDAGVDAGRSDSGVDAGRVDAGAPDAAVSDAGLDDAGSAPDAGADAGVPFDAGPPLQCALQSYTSTGFDRFVQRFALDERRQLLQVGFHGAVLNSDAGLQLFSSRDGHPLAQLGAAGVLRSNVASLSDGGLVFAEPRIDGGLALTWWSMQVNDTLDVPADISALAVAKDDAVWAWNGLGTVTRVAPRSTQSSFSAPDASGPLLMTDGTAVTFGQYTQLRLLSDGGTVLTELNLTRDGGPIAEPQAQHAMMSTDTTVLFDRRCRAAMMSCLPDDVQLFARAVNSSNQTTQWETPVLRDVTTDKLMEIQLLDFAPGAFAALIKRESDAGVLAAVRVFANGSTVAECAIPEPNADITKAIFAGDQLITVTTSDAGSRLSAWPMRGVPLLNRAWSRPNATSGERRAVP